MTDICGCLYPIWIYDADGKEYFAIPAEIGRDIGMIKQENLGDIEVTINRDDQDIKFLAIPCADIIERGIDIPDIEMVDHEYSGVIKQFMKVTWMRAGSGTYTKEYEVREHIFIAGCEFSDTIKRSEFDANSSDKENETLKCVDKSVYAILHPIDEFVDKHIVELA